jgi:hypothetical protein
LGVVHTPSPIGIHPPPGSPNPTEGTDARRPSRGEAFVLGVGETAVVDVPAAQGRATALELRFESVLNDSRCPRLVQCVVAGDATVVVVAQLAGRPPETLELHTSPQPGGLPVAYGFYTVRIAALNPLADHPSDRIDPAAYQAQLVVALASPKGPGGTPTAGPRPTGQDGPAIATDACTLVVPEQITERFGPLAEDPRPDVTADGHGQQCTFAAERGTVTLVLYAGDRGRARALAEELRAGQAAITTEDESPNSFDSYVESQDAASLVSQFGDRVLVAAVRFSPQAQRADRDQVHEALSMLANIAYARYIAGATSARATPPPMPPPPSGQVTPIPPDVTVIVN